MTQEQFVKAAAIQEKISDLNGMLHQLEQGNVAIYVADYSASCVASYLDTKEACKFLAVDCETKIKQLQEEFENI